MPTGDTSLKKRALLLFLCGDKVIWKRVKSTKMMKMLDFNYETIDLTKKHEEQKIYGIGNYMLFIIPSLDRRIS
jgi:hypothetical protein